MNPVRDNPSMNPELYVNKKNKQYALVMRKIYENASRFLSLTG